MLSFPDRFGRRSTTIKMFFVIFVALLPVGVTGVAVSIFGAALLGKASDNLITWLPLLVAASAALIVFVVIDQMLIRPLRKLHVAVANHVSGTPFRLPEIRTPAHEITALGNAFAKLDGDIGRHEGDLSAALANQIKATREVHHRVKNNLQVIASLISLHARGATSADAITAYAAIQRRVDALSIVHRNHYAELDYGGIDLKELLGELAANLRAVTAVSEAPPAISIDAQRFGVSQDNAVAIAFLVTELVELSISVDAAAPIAIVVNHKDDELKACLTLMSSALTASLDMHARLAGRYARVLEGLSRQLRTTISHDDLIGMFAIDFAVVRQP